MMAGRSDRRFWLYAWLAALGVATAGYFGSGFELPRQAVVGTVTLDGRPLASGTIVFLPTGERTFSTASAGKASITNGSFSISQARGLVPARYQVAIYSGQRAAKRPNPEIGSAEDQAPDRDLIPAKFNTETELEVEIKPGDLKELRINLDSK
jgi:hypothetical protein